MAGVTELECNGSVAPKQLVIDSKRPILQNIILRSMFGLVFYASPHPSFPNPKNEFAYFISELAPKKRETQFSNFFCSLAAENKHYHVRY